jgi:AcrR family transcriptional regulator
MANSWRQLLFITHVRFRSERTPAWPRTARRAILACGEAAPRGSVQGPPLPRIVDHVRRREDLARLVVGVMQREGAEHATVRRIAKVGGFSSGVLAHYFRDKDELVVFAFRWVAGETFDGLERAVAVAAPGLPRLRAALEFMVPTTAAPSFIGVWLSLWGGAMRNPALARVHREYYARWRRYLRRFLAEAVLRRQVATPASARDAVELLSAAIDGLWISASFEPGRYPPRRRRMLVARLLRVVLGPQRP